jgi:hypothetical protein
MRPHRRHRAEPHRALLKLRGRSEAGGRISIDQAALGELLGLSRLSVNAALREW